MLGNGAKDLMKPWRGEEGRGINNPEGVAMPGLGVDSVLQVSMLLVAHKRKHDYQ